MMILIESVVLCLLFTLMVYLMSREPIKTLFHIRGFLIGEALALAVCAPAGVIVRFLP